MTYLYGLNLVINVQQMAKLSLIDEKLPTLLLHVVASRDSYDCRLRLEVVYGKS